MIDLDNLHHSLTAEMADHKLKWYAGPIYRCLGRDCSWRHAELTPGDSLWAHSSHHAELVIALLAGWGAK